MSFQVGEVVDGKYRILQRLGAGGMGEVYKVEHEFLRAVRVIKVIRPQISEAADAHERFLREAQLATKVQHQNVATLHDFSALPDGSHYMVWEFIDGHNLAQVIRGSGVLPPGEAVRLTLQALAGLEAIHRAGIIHRDISPENLMITPSGDLKIIDLGVAKAEFGDYAQTQTGMFVGKLRYSSPEQLGFLKPGEKIDSRADLYSLGVVLFEMLAGRPPFEATSPHQYFIQHAGGTNVQPIDLTALPNPLRPVLTKALESDRNKRFATAREFAAALENIPKASTAETVRTPLPSTVRAAVPTEIVPQPAKSRTAQNAIIIAAIVILLVVGVMATWFYRSRGGPAPAAPPTAVATKAPPPKPTTTTVEVTPPAAPAPVSQPQLQPEVQPKPEPQPAPVQPQPKPKPAPAPQPQPEPQPEETEVAADRTFVEGGDSSGNDAAIAFAQQRLRGVTRVALDSPNPRLAEVVRSLGLTVAEDAKVTIHFRGDVTRLRFGRKRREGTGSITRNGKTLFRYEMKPEEYRVGDTPVEAFARVLSDVFGR